MWPETVDEVHFELGQLTRLVDLHKPLLAKIRTVDPDAIDLSALAAFLHSFYTGVETIFKRIAVEIDSINPSGDKWHATLLSLMAQSTPNRPAVISDGLRTKLKEYMGFRHAFRHAYTFELKWRKMADLVLGCEGVLNRLKAELAAFLETEAD